MSMTDTIRSFVRAMKDGVKNPLKPITSPVPHAGPSPRTPRPPKKAKPVELGRIHFWPPNKMSNKLPLPTPPGAEKPIKPRTFDQFMKDRTKAWRKRHGIPNPVI